MDPTLLQWGANLIAGREALGLRQDELAEKLDPPVKQATVSRWERGLLEPRRTYKQQLCTILGIPGEDLFPLAPPVEVAS